MLGAGDKIIFGSPQKRFYSRNMSSISGSYQHHKIYLYEIFNLIGCLKNYLYELSKMLRHVYCCREL